MSDFQAVTPAVVYAPHVFSEHRTVIGTRLFRILKRISLQVLTF